MADEVAVEQIPIDQVEAQADYVKARQSGAETVERPVEKPAEEEVADKPEVEQEEAEKPEEKHKGKGGGFQKRIEGLTRQAKEAQDRADAAERRAEAAEKQLGGKPKEDAKPTPTGEPKLEDFTDYEDFLVAKAVYKLEQKQQTERKATEQELETAKAKEIFDGHNTRVIEARAKYEDFDEVVNVRTPWPEKNASKDDIAASQAFQVALFEEENSAEILYFLGKNPDELAKFAGLSPAKVVKMVGRLADKLAPAVTETEQEEEQEERPKSKAPTPIKPINTGSSRASVSLDKIDSQKEYVRLRQAGRRR